VLYIVAMWISGITQGMMWSAVNTDGTLTYSFVQSLEASKPFYLMRFIGGVFVVAGMLLMAYNVYKTVRAKEETLQPVPAAA
jgi:cytochrome c oxidase cbb3-type subunit I